MMINRARQCAAVILSVYLFVIPAWASGAFSGRVVKIVDGDTIDVLTSDKQPVRVRLAGIDAPERKQAFGLKSKETLAELVGGKAVIVSWNKKDRDGRIIGKVMLGDQDICLEQIRRGMAWHFKKYEREQSAADRVAYARAEVRARERAVGLWSEKSPEAPWDRRRARNTKG